MNGADDEAGDYVRALMAEHGRDVESLLAAIERDRAAREELWSDVFTTAYLRFDQLVGHPPDRVRGWLLRTTRNLTANAARRSTTRRRLVHRLSYDPIPTMPSAEDAYLEGPEATDDEVLAAVRQAWNQLTENQQQILLLDSMGHDGAHMARSLDISVSAARSRLMRARRAFVDRYHPHEEVNR